MPPVWGHWNETCITKICNGRESEVFCLSALYKALHLSVSDLLMIVMSDGNWYEVVKMQIHDLFKKYPTFGWEKYIYTPGGLQPKSPSK